MFFVGIGEADRDMAEGTVVHVEGAWPGDGVGVELELIAVEEVGVDEGGEEVVGGGDGVEVAMKVEVDLVRGFDLGAAAAGGSALHAEDGAEGGLAGGDDGALADVLEALDEADGGDGLAFAGDGGCGGGDENELAAMGVREVSLVEQGLVQKVKRDLGADGAAAVVEVFGEVELGGDGFDGEQVCGQGASGSCQVWVVSRGFWVALRLSGLSRVRIQKVWRATGRQLCARVNGIPSRREMA